MKKNPENFSHTSLLQEYIDDISCIKSLQWKHLSMISPEVHKENMNRIQQKEPKATEKPFRGNKNTKESPISSSCRAIVNIPVHRNERNLEHTLSLYAEQKTKERENLFEEFEVNILVNGEKNTDLQEAYFSDIVARIQEKCPKFQINLYFSQYSSSEEKRVPISKIRNDLAHISLIRAKDVKESGKIALLTHDADAVSIDPFYMDHLISSFEKNPHLKISIGRTDYPEQEYFQNHLFLAVSRFTQFLELILEYKERQFSMRGGNSVIRLEEFIKAGGFNEAKTKRENHHLYKFVRSTYETVTQNENGKKSRLETIVTDSLLKITTNARRALFTLLEGKSLAEQHKHFGEKNDVSYQYFVAEKDLFLPDMAMKVTHKNFKETLSSQMTQSYKALVSNILYQKSRAVSENNIQMMKNFITDYEKFHSYIKRAANFLGIEVKLIPDKKTREPQNEADALSPPLYTLQVIDISRFESAVKRNKKYNLI
jgi:hypothetical protein